MSYNIDARKTSNMLYYSTDFLNKDSRLSIIPIANGRLFCLFAWFQRSSGHDWCIVELGLWPRGGQIYGLEIDTAHFTGNYPPRVSIQAARCSPIDGQNETEQDANAKARLELLRSRQEILEAGGGRGASEQTIEMVISTLYVVASCGPLS